ncbi:hypothetical protein [Mucilaginibacter gilvus]|uniref:Uncharacterized protein n=1 Tax=Mucilaginibacter gilvus TaxID=2305909 RepID=A0A444MLA3_9SPHI|nr:hypothetical protein [Mucilaginibacter gilvus]RWY50023.1 hypothetical protein EPL05_14770 [Mucilaginibacter gilvus]
MTFEEAKALKFQHEDLLYYLLNGALITNIEIIPIPIGEKSLQEYAALLGRHPTHMPPMCRSPYGLFVFFDLNDSLSRGVPVQVMAIEYLLPLLPPRNEV